MPKRDDEMRNAVQGWIAAGVDLYRGDQALISYFAKRLRHFILGVPEPVLAIEDRDNKDAAVVDFESRKPRNRPT